jgi:hypothetical protein
VLYYSQQQRKQTMAKFVYKQTQTFYLHIDADTQEEADAIAEKTETYADDVSATELTGWELELPTNSYLATDAADMGFAPQDVPSCLGKLPWGPCAPLQGFDSSSTGPSFTSRQ